MRKTVALVLVCLLSPFAGAASLDDIRFAELPDQRFEVRLSFDEAPPEPQGYTIESPARIVLDFPEVESELKERRFPLAFDNGKSALVLTSGGRTRLILNLGSLSTYSSRIDGNSYVIEVGGTGSRQVAARKPVTDSAASTQPRTSAERAISGIDFRRGDAGEGRIIVDLSTDRISADMRDTADGLRVTFANTSLPGELRRRLDVLDFATPVAIISASSDSGDVVLDVSANGDYDYLAYQTDNQYVISVKPLTPAEKAEQERLFEYTGSRLSFNFQDIEVRAVLQIIADFTDLNLVASDTVQGRITLRLDNVPWDQALDMVLKTKGLDKRQVGNVLMVAPASEIAERERQELSTKRQLEELAPLRTEYIRVRYASAKEIFALFQGDGGGDASGSDGPASRATGSILSGRGQAVVDERTNSIIVTDTSERIDALKRLVEEIDIPIRQVMIEARLVIANKDFREELGVRWGGVGASLSSDALLEVGGSTGGLDSSPGSPADFIYGGGSINLEENMMVDMGVANPVGSIAFGLLTDNAYLDLELSALEYNGYAEIVSQPKVITGDKQRATISTGSEIPYQEASASGATAASFKEVVLELDVTPQITPDNNIIMELAIKKDLLAEFNTEFGVPIIDITRLNTKVLVSDGQTIVLGGIFEMQQLNGVDKVPFLGDIPYLGRLFRRDVKTSEKSELLIFITPRIMAESLTE
ncbi:type IV pilus secretin PilQ family protein [uncultured Gilvimarinus sp.]|uniref:type IV pilus secretin PilQ n=1 Tax=uncultured Gilvimarinus sp. TaxID=1689143 RepID=UPI0030D6F450